MDADEVTLDLFKVKYPIKQILEFLDFLLDNFCC